MTHDEVIELYRKVLGRGLYGPEILVPRIRRALEAAGHTVTLERGSDLAKLPPEALEAAAAYLSDGHYAATPDTDRAARLARKAG
jgi:hypothetical protein